VHPKEAQTEAETLKEDRKSLRGIEYKADFFSCCWCWCMHSCSLWQA